MYGDEYFDNYDPHNRNPISFHDLQDLPLLDDSGSEIPIFTDHGYRIKRRFGSRLTGTPPLAVLMNLRNLDQLFISDDLFGDFDPSHGPTTFHVYPQAGLVTAGHFQADGLPSAFAPLLHTLNSDVQLHDDISMEDDPLAISQDSLPPPILAVCCQGYNALMHHTRGRFAQHHDAQRGLVTSTLAGSWAKTQKNVQTAKLLQLQCNERLPHYEFKQKIANNNDNPLDCSLRLENTYIVDLDRLDPDYRTGGTFLQYIIYELGMFWSHPSMMCPLQDHSILFKPQIYPQIYNWTTFPLVTLIEKIYNQCSTSMIASRHPCPGLVELCSVAERALNYMHTGNAAVIATSVMNPLWVGNAIVRDGLPCFNTNIVALNHVSPVAIIQEKWPFDTFRHHPKSSSKAAQIFTFGIGHFNVSTLVLDALSLVRLS
ncbi:hypothetical protein AX14_006410 [Amanita brunnescens Koide BX004]|nr:hypothetical protein AX14_006410 [Amanita brunnescens Koide BX004]